jgi:hypothetical protein
MDESKMKICPKCGISKPLTEYFKRGAKSHYYAGYCKACHSKPFHYEKIVCPHCEQKIAFFGVDASDRLIHHRSTIINKLMREIRTDKKAKKHLKDKKIQSVQKAVSLKEVFEDE